MRKILPIILVGILVLSGIGAVATSNEQTYKTETKNVEFTKPVIRNQGEFITINIDNTNSFLIKQNKPLLPCYTHTFTFPADTIIKSVTCKPINIQTQAISKDIIPSPTAIPVGNTFTTHKVEETQYYLKEEYPDTWYTYDIGRGIDNDQPALFVNVQFIPVKIDPLEKTIKWAESVEIQIEYDPQTIERNNNDEYDLVILTPDKYSSQLQSLVNHKNNRGIKTKLVTLNEIYDSTYFSVQGRDNAEKVKYFIKNAYDNWMITNVLIVGGNDDFPTRETHVKVSNDDDEIFISDLYFADLYDGEGHFVSWDSNENDIFAEHKWEGETDEIDFYPDVKLGRIACISSQQANTIVDKIITYENSKAYTQNWFNNLVVIGGDTVPKSYGDNEEVDEGELVNQAILDIMDGFIPDKIWDSNNRLSGLVPTGVQNINNGINNGCGFVDFSGHGAPWIWTTFPHNGDRQSLPTPTGRYTNSIIEGLNNGDELPIAVCGGCSLGKYNSNSNCFAWAFLSNSNGGGIASFGATGLGYVYIGSHVTKGLVEGLTILLFEAFDEGAKSFGEIWTDGLNKYITSNMEAHDWKTLMEWQPFGDPTLTIAEESLPPIKPGTPDGPGSGSIGTSYTYSASTTDPDEDELYYLFDWGDGTYSDWIGPKSSGQTAEASHSWSSQGSFNIKVKAKDIHGVQSEWSDPLPVSMPKSKTIQSSLLLKILDIFPNAFPILRLILDL